MVFPWSTWFSRRAKNSAEVSLSDRQQKTAPRILRSLDHVKAADVAGDEPSDELLVEPSNLLFRSSDDFQEVSFAEFDITNRDVFPVAYSIRTKVNIFTVQHNQAYGFLRPREKTTIRLWLKSSEAWSRGTEDYIMKRIPIMVMSVRVPENIRPNDDLVVLFVLGGLLSSFDCNLSIC